MARTPQVTRTIQTTKATVLCLNLQTQEPFTQEIVLPRTYKSEKELMKVVSPAVDTETVKAVHVVNTEIVETLYGTTEQEFINVAHILPPRTTAKKA